MNRPTDKQTRSHLKNFQLYVKQFFTEVTNLITEVTSVITEVPSLITEVTNFCYFNKIPNYCYCEFSLLQKNSDLLELVECYDLKCLSVYLSAR